MIHASWVWLAWVARAMPGSATFSDDIAATTAASARHTTAVTAPERMVPAGGDFTGRGIGAFISQLLTSEHYDLE
jgi:hypothetical protein